jgi:DNA processing protein
MAADLTTDDKIDWLRLCRTAGIGPKSFFRLLHRCGSAAAALQALPRLAREAGREPPRCCSEAEARAELEALTALGCRLVAHGEPGYPKQLGRIHDPPPLLTLRGDPAVLELPAVALVGARNASAKGRLLARRFAGELAAGGTQGAGLAVVSGLARGIDTAAHEGALAAGGCTIAVIAAGVDIAYPEENAALMAAIAAQGLVVSERPFGAAPQARHFPRRNRLIAGLSAGVVVVEAAPKSGSLITARMALEQGREVMAVPGSPLDARHRGTNQFLRDGAALVESAEDIRQALGPLGSAPQPGRKSWTLGPASGREQVEPLAPPPASVPKAPAALSTGVAKADPGFSGLAERVCEHLGTEPLLVDELVRQCHANSAEMQHALLELELDARIERHPGNRVSLASSRLGNI